MTEKNSKGRISKSSPVIYKGELISKEQHGVTSKIALDLLKIQKNEMSLDAVVHFKCKNFEKALKQILKIYDRPIFSRDLIDLKWLKITNNKIKDISPISQMTNLVYLDLTDNEITKIDLSSNTKLEYLKLDKNDISDLNLTKNNSELRYLYVHGNLIKDIRPFTCLNKLIELDIGNNRGFNVDDIYIKYNNAPAINSAIKQRKNSIKYIGKPFETDCLRHLVNLEYLDVASEHYTNIYDSKISDTTFLKDLINLKDLNLSGNNIEDISSIKYLTKLNFLSLEYNSIKVLDSLKFCEQLSSLLVTENKITDISVLRFLHNLCYLIIDGNEIYEISPLFELKQLKTIYMKNTPAFILRKGETSDQINQLRNALPDASFGMHYPWGDPLPSYSVSEGGYDFSTIQNHFFRKIPSIIL